MVRGHTYIGGCERAHIDVLVRETEGGLEIWTAISGRRGAFETALGRIPRDARPVRAAENDRYEGDPSIGPT